MSFIGSIWTRAKGFLKWLVSDPWPVWVGVGVPLLILRVTWLMPQTGELRIRTAGFAITLLGVLLVVKAIPGSRPSATVYSDYSPSRSPLSRS